MTPVFPRLDHRPGLGIGLDLAYGDAHGFVLDGDRDVLLPRVAAFLRGEGAGLGYGFFSFQPRDRVLLHAEHYLPAWDALFAAIPRPPVVGLHHTMLNLGTIDRRVDRTRLLACTNALIARNGLAWVNEDLGIWSIDGKLMPYPLPPLLTPEGCARAIEQVQAVMAGLAAPLLLEFPGFSEGTNFVVGRAHAYDFFREIAEATGVAVTLDTGHLLSYQWFLGRRGDDLFGELDRLPLDHCFEIHCSGCQIIDGRFVDVHHGVLRDEQLDLLEILLERCPHLHCVAYEDPKVDAEGRLHPKAVAGFQRLKAIMQRWEDRRGLRHAG